MMVVGQPTDNQFTGCDDPHILVQGTAVMGRPQVVCVMSGVAVTDGEECEEVNACVAPRIRFV